MRHLTARPSPSLNRGLRNRLRNDEQGQVSVIAAIVMVVLLGFAALVVDVGLLYFERAQLKNGADAGALAIAQECAEGACPGDPQGLVDGLANANANDGDATAAPPLIDLTVGRVTVTTSTPADRPLALAFAPVLGIDTASMNARSVAGWFSPVGGRKVLPLAISWCQFQNHLDTGLQLIETNPNKILDTPGCGSDTAPGYAGTGPSIPGGFGWLHLSNTSVCATSIDLSGLDLDDPSTSPQVPGDTGNNIPNSCRDQLKEMLKEPILVPIFSEVGGSGSSGWYRIIGFASFQLHGWNFSGESHNNTTAPYVCKGDCRGLIGEFVSFVTLDAGEQDYIFGAGELDLGTRLVTLVD